MLKILSSVLPVKSHSLKSADFDKNNVSDTNKAAFDSDGSKCYNYLDNLADINKLSVNFSGVQKINTSYPKHKIENYTASLIGGAVGDALGAPVEFDSLNRIQHKYGSDGITDLQLFNGKADITDDTQMTIFTADGLIKSALNGFDENALPDMKEVFDSYRDWLDTQYSHYHPTKNGWISNIPELYSRRAPGLTCTGSLKDGIPGSIERPLNSSKGCGGVMRVAPAGLMYYKNPEIAFETGARCAAITHGSPDAYLAAGLHSAIISYIIQGQSLEDSVNNSLEIMKKYEGSENLLKLMERAKELAASDMKDTSAIRILGEGWHGDEAIAISVFCALRHQDDFKAAVISAVNHDGDSDSTGAITGNIMGAYLGIDAIPQNWQNQIELNQELRVLAQDLFSEPSKIESADKRYCAIQK